ncbi:MAG: epoxyqueuosine reductase QueH, partial [Lactococcus garvieae]
MKNATEILEKMNPNQKVNYDRVYQKMRESWEAEGI